MDSNRPLKVLMIGNSFSICVLKHMPAIARELGCKLDLTSLYIGGCPLERHAANIFAGNSYDDFKPYMVTWSYSSLENQGDVPFFPLLGNTEEVDGKIKGWCNIPMMLEGDEWDVVSIQQASHESWKPTSFYPWAELVIEEIRRRAPSAKIVVQETWSYCNADRRICDQETGGAGAWGFDQTEMYNRLRANYAELAAKNGFEVIPTGDAVQLFRERFPVRAVEDDVVGNRRVNDEGVVSMDCIHLNPDGEYLQACVWTEKLFGADVRKLATVPDVLLKPAAVELLRECAHDAVADWGLSL